MWYMYTWYYQHQRRKLLNICRICSFFPCLLLQYFLTLIGSSVLVKNWKQFFRNHWMEEGRKCSNYIRSIYLITILRRFRFRFLFFLRVFLSFSRACFKHGILSVRSKIEALSTEFYLEFEWLNFNYNSVSVFLLIRSTVNIRRRYQALSRKLRRWDAEKFQNFLSFGNINIYPTSIGLRFAIHIHTHPLSRHVRFM